MGSGSDYTPFLQHLGIASLDVRFAAGDSGVYHSDYDDFNWFSHFSDTNFVYGRTLSQVHATAMMRFADAPLVPFEFGHLASTISRYVDEIQGLQNTPRQPYLAGVRAEVARLQKTAAALDLAEMRALPGLASASPDHLAAINRILFRTERSLTMDPGLPGQPLVQASHLRAGPVHRLRRENTAGNS